MSSERGVLLIADDEEMNKVLLARRLKREGFATMDASDGEEVLAKLRTLSPEDRPRIVLMDINMPVMDGIETTKILKSEFASLPIIAVTAGVFLPDEINAHGFDDFCTKPIDFQELMNKIHRLLAPNPNGLLLPKKSLGQNNS